MKTLADLGTAKLLRSEQARVRDAADALLFCTDIIGDPSARAALLDVDDLCARLVDSNRWSRRLAGELADDVYACGPSLEIHLRAA
jgi:hypothetical protein